MKILGYNCHPSHTASEREKKLEARAKRYREEQERTFDQQKRDLARDPRKIQVQHRWKLGHNPADQDDYDDPNVTYVKFDGREAPPTEPDQLNLLHGGPPVAMNCERCGDQLHAVGEMSSWGQMTQDGVVLVNKDKITAARKRELQEEIIVILACPGCRSKFQWMKKYLPL